MTLAILANVRGFLFILISFLLSLYMAWMANAYFGYGFSWLYHHYEIEQHVAKFAPHNRYRSGYQFTSSEQQKQNFQQIVDSVHNNGEGLAEIKYQSVGKQYLLLHKAEVIHLQDVANLINKIHYLAGFAFVVWFLLLVLRYFAYKNYPYIKASKKGLTAVLFVVIATLVMVFSIYGAKVIFYQMHIWIFPKNHQWFFYYQESLMSTLMKAPDLFAGIAIQILALAVIFFATAIVVGIRFLPKLKKVLGL